MTGWHAAATWTMADWQDYQDGRRVGARDYTTDRPYDSDPSDPAWSLGYRDGWRHEAETLVTNDDRAFEIGSVGVIRNGVTREWTVARPTPRTMFDCCVISNDALPRTRPT